MDNTSCAAFSGGPPRVLAPVGIYLGDALPGFRNPLLFRANIDRRDVLVTDSSEMTSRGITAAVADWARELAAVFHTGRCEGEITPLVEAPATTGLLDPAAVRAKSEEAHFYLGCAGSDRWAAHRVTTAWQQVRASSTIYWEIALSVSILCADNPLCCGRLQVERELRSLHAEAGASWLCTVAHDLTPLLVGAGVTRLSIDWFYGDDKAIADCPLPMRDWPSSLWPRGEVVGVTRVWPRPVHQDLGYRSPPGGTA